MSTVKIDPDQLLDCSRALGEVGEHSSRLASKIALNNNLGSFTRVSGLDQLGREHAGVLDTGPGSARVVAQGLGDVISGLARGLQATVHGFEAQEDVFARSLDRLHDAGSSPGICGGESGGVPAEKLGMIALPEHVAPVPVVVGQKVVVPAGSVLELLRDYFTTHTSAIGEAASAWKGLHTSMVEVTGRLRSIANGIVDANRGEVIDAIVDKLRVTSEATESFGANAEAMARWSGRIGLTHKLGIAAAGAINGSVLANPIPGARQLQEQLALVAYARVAMPPLLSLAEPRVGSLLDTVVPPSTGGAWEEEMDELVSGSKKDFDGQLERIRSGNPDPVLVRALQHATDDGSVSQQVEASPGARLEETPVLAGQSHTAPQGLTVPLAGGHGGGLTPVGSSPAGTGMPVSSSVPGDLRREGIGGGAAVPVGAVNSDVGGANARGGSCVDRSETHPVSTVAPAGVGRNGGQRGTTAGKRLPSAAGSSKHQGGSGIAAGSAFGAISGGAAARNIAGGLGGVGFSKLPAIPDSGSHTGSTVRAGTAHGGNVGVPASGSRATGGYGRGVMPMNMGASKDRKTTRPVKTVFSELEQDANTKAILGEVPPMVPGTIGAWARS